jgi:3-deoxy-D-manno-octulosonate 8-phosphate phosphatase (KDO 8-P phosphatase)
MVAAWLSIVQTVYARAGQELEMSSPALNFAPGLLLQAQGVRAAIFDVDGVLTDGRLYIGEHGEVFKAFHTLDGHGLKLLAAGGIEPVVVSGRDSPALRRRLADLGITRIALGAGDKLAVAQPLLDALQLSWSQIAVIGDDWPDAPLMRRAQFACAVPQAHAEVRAIAHHVTLAPGGQGAAREFCDLLLCAAGRYVSLWATQTASLDRA